MKIYFVRHGETFDNVKRIHQDGNAELSDIGIKQANDLATRFENIHIEKIISSPYERAKKTAEIIASTKELQVEFSSLFVERKRPTEIENKTVDSEEVLKIKEEIKAHYEDVNWNYSDEENAEDVKKRALEAIRFLENQDEESILVVTHGTIMRIILGTMIFGEDMTPKESKKLQGFLLNTNTGITICEYNSQKWQLLTWNDFAHLGD